MSDFARNLFSNKHVLDGLTTTPSHLPLQRNVELGNLIARYENQMSISRTRQRSLLTMPQTWSPVVTEIVDVEQVILNRERRYKETQLYDTRVTLDLFNFLPIVPIVPEHPTEELIVEDVRDSADYGYVDKSDPYESTMQYPLVPYEPNPQDSVVSYQPNPQVSVVPYESIPQYHLDPSVPYEPIPQYHLDPSVPYEPIPQYHLDPSVPYEPIQQYHLDPSVPYEPIPQYHLDPSVPYEPIPQYHLGPSVPYEPIPQYHLDPSVPYEPIPQYHLDPSVPYEPIPQYHLDPAVPYQPIPQYHLDPSVPYQPIPQYHLDPSVPYEPIPQYHLDPSISYEPIPQYPSIPYEPNPQYPSVPYEPINESPRTGSTNPTGPPSVALKLYMKEWNVFPEHRSGWSYAMKELSSLHKPDGTGIRVIDFMEKVFSWDLATSGQSMFTDKTKRKILFDEQFYMVPANSMRMVHHRQSFLLPTNQIVSFDYKNSRWQVCHTITKEQFATLRSPDEPIMEPWIGFLHNPPNAPLWFDSSHSPWQVLKRHITRESLKSCRGIFVMSDYLKQWLRQQPEIPLDLPISVVFHPSELDTDTPTWTWEKYTSNPDKSIIQVGYWLRIMKSIAELEVPRGFVKKWMYGNSHALDCLDQELAHSRNRAAVEDLFLNTVQIVDHIDNQQYDIELSKNIVFLEMYDSSCNNAVIECILRRTPVLVNKLPAVIEYLGTDYPFYFESLQEASWKLSQPMLINKTHQYLCDHPELAARLNGKRFVQDVLESEVYMKI